MNGQEILDATSEMANDVPREFWTLDEQIQYLNDGRKLVYTVKPKVYEKTDVVSLVAGFAQTLPNGSDILFMPVNNVTHRGKRGITSVSRELLTRGRPHWRSDSESDEIVHVMYTETEPQVYEVWPPAKSGTEIRLSYAVPPTTITQATLGDELVQERELANAYFDYVLYRMYEKESDTSPDIGQRAIVHAKAFGERIGVEGAVKAKASTNANTKGASPARTAN